MRILLVADDTDDSVAVQTALSAQGHEVASCNDEFGGPCRGLDHLQDCPLEKPVDLAVIARSGNTRRSIAEMGAVCASRHRVGVIEIDPMQMEDDAIEDLAATAERAVCHEYERQIIRELGDGVYVTVHRRQGMVMVTLTVAPARGADLSATAMAALADKARDATRRHDRFARSIDVSVIRSE